MLFRKTVFALALAGAAIPAAFAAGGSAPVVGGEASYEPPRGVQGTKNRADVKKEAAASRKGSVTADGGKEVGGEVGYVPPGHSTAIRGGKRVHTDSLPHDAPKPSRVMTDAEKRQAKELIKEQH